MSERGGRHWQMDSDYVSASKRLAELRYKEILAARAQRAAQRNKIVPVPVPQPEPAPASELDAIVSEAPGTDAGLEQGAGIESGGS